MALSSSDETDLLLPLIGGAQDSPPFSGFLGRLRARTGAEHVSIIIHETGTPLAEQLVYFAGVDLRAHAREVGFEPLFLLDGVHHEKLRLDRVYSVAEFTDHDPELKAQRAFNMGRIGIVDERVIRISGGGGHSVSMAMARSRPCSASDSALLSNLAPYVSAAISNLRFLSRRQSDAGVAAGGLQRSGLGWVQFDREARIASVDPATAEHLERATGSPLRIGERLRGIGQDAERALIALASRPVDAPSLAPRIVRLVEEPQVDALLVPVDRHHPAAFATGVVAAYCRFPRRPSAEGALRFATLFGLAPREAELAVALAQGHSIADAGHQLGLTLETARNYSKRIYSKLGVRGQSDVVRLVLESSMLLY
ncbi:MAG TPA: helix-turn-helix transcriptional regulator [Novosphingobium sp.]|nr:helix-turn-helix transcriptional regulator [Novosphingobium sp.]